MGFNSGFKGLMLKAVKKSLQEEEKTLRHNVSLLRAKHNLFQAFSS